MDCTAEHLLQFAIMGAALTQAVDHRDNPTVGLLNIGEEVIKGNEVVKEAAELLRSSPLNFYGNVEGNDIFKGTVDVVVCDGFVGNVVLKSVEGLAKMLSSVIREEFKRNLITLLARRAGQAGAQPPAQPRRQSPLQRRRLAGLAWRRDQEPRFGGRLCLRFRPAARREAVVSKLLERTARTVARSPGAFSLATALPRPRRTRPGTSLDGYRNEIFRDRGHRQLPAGTRGFE